MTPNLFYFRSFIQVDPTLNFIDDDGLICVKSPENNLWMRGVVIKDIDHNSVRFSVPALKITMKISGIG